MKKTVLMLCFISVLALSLHSCSSSKTINSSDSSQVNSSSIISGTTASTTEELTEIPAKAAAATGASIELTAQSSTQYDDLVGTGTEEVTIRNITYLFDYESKTLYISGRRIVGPDSTDELYEKVHKWEKMAEKVVVKFGTTYIGYRAFSNCESLKHIELPSSLNKVDDDFLGNLKNLEKISFSFPSPFFSVDNGVLFNRSKTKLIKYPAKLEAESFAIPKTVTEVSEYAFWYADNLKEITLPSNLEPIENPLVWFIACDNLKKIIVPESNRNFSSDEQGVLYNKDMTDIIIIPAKVESFVIPDTVTELSRYDFAHECSLSKVTIGENCQVNEWFLLYESQNIEFDVSKKSKYYSMSDSILYNKDKTELLLYPKNKTDKKFTVPNTVKTVKNLDNTYLEEIVFSDSVCSVNRIALSGCTGLKKIYLGKNFTEIIYDGEFDVEFQNPFVHCNNLEKITVASGNKHFRVDSQGALYTYDMTKLIAVPANGKIKEFTVPDSIAIIFDCFKNCSKIEKIHFGSGVENICIGVEGTESIVGFSGCVSLKSISVSKNNKNYVSSNGILFSKDMTKLYLYPANKAGDRYIVPESVKHINDYAFFNNQNLKMIYLSKNTDASLYSLPMDENHELTAEVYFEGPNINFSYIDSPKLHFNAKSLPA